MNVLLAQASDTPDMPEIGAGAGIAALLFNLVFLAIGIVVLISVWKVYTKAGKPGWACIIPFYNVIVLLEIVGRPLWWIILFLIPGVNLIIIIIVSIDLAKSFGKGAGFGIGLALVGFICYPILGFGDAQYQGPAAAEGAAPAA